MTVATKLVRKKQQNFQDGTQYEGDWERGAFHGRGVLTWANGCVYEGDFRKGERHGQGTCTFPGGERYTGAWQDGKMHGEGSLEIRERKLTGTWDRGVPNFGPPGDGFKRFVFPDGKGVYEGNWRGSKRHGQGSFTFANGDVYDGMWFHGEMTGEGKYDHNSGDIYIGEFKDGQMHGEGTYVWPDALQCYVGQWQHGKRQGHGRHFFSSCSPGGPEEGEYYDGKWKEGVMHGKATYVDAGGEKHEGVWVDGVCPEVDFTHVQESGNFRYRFSGGTYEGDWLNRAPHGHGRMVYSNGSVYIGDWRDFKFHGYGKLVQEGGVIFEGQWREGRMHGSGSVATEKRKSGVADGPSDEAGTGTAVTSDRDALKSQEHTRLS